MKKKKPRITAAQVLATLTALASLLKALLEIAKLVD